MVIFSSSLWGLSGTAAQYLFSNYEVQPGFLVELRMFFSGIILLLLFYLKRESNGIHQRVSGSDVLSIIIFGIVGLLAVQLTYFLTIDFSNAGTATLLQYIYPFFIMAWLAVTSSKSVLPAEILSIVLAMGGLFFLLTDGSLSGIKISNLAVLFGLLSAVAAAFYTLYPRRLIQRFNTTMVTGWGMLSGSLIIMPLYAPWSFGDFRVDWISISLVIFVIIFGTALAFMLYLDSLKYIKPSEASILSVFEPLSAVAVTVLVLGTRLGMLQIVGGGLIVTSTVILSIRTGKAEPAKSNSG
ncbi:MAG: DMT family transporter [Thermoplasmataceae archaeon]